MEDQLIKSSQEAAREIASLRMKIFDLEMTGGGSSVGDFDDEGDDLKVARTVKSSLLIPFENMMEDKTSKAPSRGSTANSSMYADLGGKVYAPSRSQTRNSAPASPIISSNRIREVDAAVPERKSRERSREGHSQEMHHSQTSKPYMEKAYRPDSKSGSPRPVSPSETSDIMSFGGSPRMPSSFPIASARRNPHSSDLRLPLSGHIPSPDDSERADNSPAQRQELQSQRQSMGSRNADSSLVTDTLQSLLGVMESPPGSAKTPPPLGDLSLPYGVDALEGVARKPPSIGSVRSSRSAGSVHV